MKYNLKYHNNEYKYSRIVFKRRKCKLTLSCVFQFKYSLTSFLEVFEFSLKKSMPDSIVLKRLKNIMDTLTHNIYNYGCTGIFERHKLLFSFQITLKLEMDRQKVKQSELDFFIKVAGVSKHSCVSLAIVNYLNILDFTFNINNNHHIFL